MDRKKLIRKLRMLLDRMKEIDSNIERATKEAFLIGTAVSYQHGDRLRFVSVVGHSEFGRPRLYVEGPTGKRYWIDVYSVLEALEQ